MDNFSHLLPTFNNKFDLEKYNGTTKDIMEAMDRVLPRAAKDVKKISSLFRGVNDIATAHKIHQFLRVYFIFKKDVGNQILKYPRASIRLRYNDCKSYSILAGSLLYDLHIPFTFKFAGYTSANKPTHVYIQSYFKYAPNGKRDPNGHRFILDGCYHLFNVEKMPRFAKLGKLQTNNQL